MPARLGRYAVRRRIGSGGFATVWLAYDEQLDSPVAIKVLAENWTEDSHVRQRFLEEGRYLRKVESPHVVSVYDAGSLEDDRPYLVMSYADQGTLADRLEADGLTVAQATEVIRQVGEGLAALHQRGVLHRDIKPANVLFRTVDPEHDGTLVRAMVGDLGLGKALDVSSRLTMIAGTPVVRRARAGPGRAPRRPSRPVLPGRAVLPAPDRPTAVRPRHPVGRCQPGAADADVDAGAALPARGRGRRTTWARRGPRRPLPRRTVLRRGAPSSARGRGGRRAARPLAAGRSRADAAGQPPVAGAVRGRPAATRGPEATPLARGRARAGAPRGRRCRRLRRVAADTLRRDPHRRARHPLGHRSPGLEPSRGRQRLGSARQHDQLPRPVGGRQQPTGPTTARASSSACCRSRRCRRPCRSTPVVAPSGSR